MRFRINTNDSIEYYKAQFEKDPIPLKDKFSIRVRATVETVIRAAKLAFHKISMIVDSRRKNREEELEEHSERFERHLICLQVSVGLIVKPKETLDDLPDEIESDESTQEEIPQETFSLRLNKKESVERYQTLFGHRKVALKHHVAVRLRAVVETVVQAVKTGYHATMAGVDGVNMRETHEERRSVHLMALKMVAPIAIHPKKQFKKLDEADLEALESNRI
jgi:hypothetical protein